MFCFTDFIFCIIMFQTSTFLLFYSRNSPRELFRNSLALFKNTFGVIKNTLGVLSDGGFKVIRRQHI